MKKFKFTEIFSALVLMIATVAANTTCICIYHQPELPEAVKKLRKF